MSKEARKKEREQCVRQGRNSFFLLYSSPEVGRQSIADRFALYALPRLFLFYFILTRSLYVTLAIQEPDWPQSYKDPLLLPPEC